MDELKALPEGWVHANLEDVCDICDNLRKPINSAERLKRVAGKPKNELYPYYGATGLVGYIDGYLTDGEYVLLGEDGAPFLDYTKNIAYLINGKTWVNNHAHILLSYFNNKYLLHFLNQFNYKGYVSGTTRLKLTQSSMKKLPVKVAPLPEQHRIVAKIEELFSSLDKGTENLKTAQAQLKTYRQAVLKWAFEGKLTNENLKDGELPGGWKTYYLKDICKIAGGVTKGRDFKGKQTTYLPYLRVANVQDGYLNLNEIKTIEALPTDLDKYRLRYGDILYTEGGDKDKLGRGTIWRDEIKNCIHQNHIFRARIISNDYDPKYIALFSQTKTAKDYFYNNGKQTTNLASINLTILSSLPVTLPPTHAEQIRIVSEIETRLSVCDKLEESITQSLLQAEALRQSILKKAFEGKLAPQNPDDEPASVLLERIRAERESTIAKNATVANGKKGTARKGRQK